MMAEGCPPVVYLQFWQSGTLMTLREVVLVWFTEQNVPGYPALPKATGNNLTLSVLQFTFMVVIILSDSIITLNVPDLQKQF